MTRRLLRAMLLMLIPITVLSDETADVQRVQARPIAVATSGVQRGEWTMDMEAAKQFAASNSMPLFLSFTGSDWCPHCTRAERDVFALPEWKAFAADKFVLVNIDLPRSPSLIPPPVRNRNEALQYTFDVQGFPTFLVVDADGRTVVKRLGMPKELNITNFIRDVASSFRHRPDDVRRMVSTMGRGQAAAYTNLIGRMLAVEKEAQAWIETKPERNAENMRKLQDFVSQTATLEGAIDEIEAEKALIDLSGADNGSAAARLRSGREQIALLGDLRAIQSELESWLLSRPPNTPENRERLAALIKRLADVQAKLK